MKLVPVEGDPFKAGPRLVLVEGNPFEPQDSVPQWGRDSPNLYGAYGAAKGIYDTLVDTGKLAGRMVANAPGDLYDLGRETVQAVAQPVDTLNSLGELAIGVAQKAVPGQQEHEKKVDTIWDSAKGVVTDPRKLTEYVGEHPAKTLALMSGGGSLAGSAMQKAGQLANAQRLSRAGQMVGRAGAAIDPLSLTARSVGKAAKKAGNTSAEMLGMSTGSGVEAVKQAANSSGFRSGSNRFAAAMRGKIPLEETLGRAKGALSTLKKDRGEKIRAELGAMKSNKAVIDKQPIMNKVGDLMKRFNIKVVQKADGTRELDFSRSVVDKAARNDVKEIIMDVAGWGSRTDDLTPSGLHILKQRLDDFYSDSKNSRAFVTELRNQVKGEIVKAVPEYAKMMKGYEQATKTINEIEKALSLGDRVMMDTAIKKLISTNRENFEFRRVLRDQLEGASGVELSSEIAGHAMNQMIPKGLVGKLSAGTGIMSDNPLLLGVASLSSPRAVGEMLNFAGYTAKQIKGVVDGLKESGAFSPGKRNAAAISTRLTENDYHRISP